MSDTETRIQIRRGTATEWSNVNPILGAGEPGYDLTNRIFKIGDGTTRWASLSGISEGGITQQDLDDAISNVVDTAPETLNTLNELAAAINDNPNFFNEVAYSGGDISQFNNNVGYLTSENNDLTANVTWASVPDANVTESSVIQHSGALRITESQIVDLQNYVVSGDNVSVLTNDANYIASGDNISLLNNDVNYIESDTVGITGASGVNNIVQISQSDYDAIGSGNYDPNTIYFVV